MPNSSLSLSPTLPENQPSYLLDIEWVPTLSLCADQRGQLPNSSLSLPPSLPGNQPSYLLDIEWVPTLSLYADQ